MNIYTIIVTHARALITSVSYHNCDFHGKINNKKKERKKKDL